MFPTRASPSIKLVRRYVPGPHIASPSTKDKDTAPSEPAGRNTGDAGDSVAAPAAVLSKTICSGRPVGVADVVPERVPVELGVSDADDDAVAVREPVPLELAVLLTLALTVSLRLCVWLGLRVGVREKDAVAVTLGLAVPERVCVGVGEQIALTASSSTPP